MQKIVSGTTTGRIARTLLLTGMFGGYAAWSLYDGFVAYPRANVEAVLKSKLGQAEPDRSIRPRSDITPQTISAVGSETSWDRITAQLGQPQIEHQGRAYYLGTGGYVTIDQQAERGRRLQWSDGPVHSPASIGFQKLIGFLLIPVTFLMILQLIRVLRTRAVLTEETLIIGRRSPIALESIEAVTRAATGRYDIRIGQGDQARTVRLDDYVIAKTPEIVRTICDRRGLPDPTAATT